MDKQQFDHIENRIRQAADEISIPYNEVAWNKMEVLLDDEFNKDNRRRGGFWWWISLMLLILAGSGIYFYQSRSTILSNKSAVNHSFQKTVLPYAGSKVNPGGAKQKDSGAQGLTLSQKEKTIQILQPDKNENLSNGKPGSQISIQNNDRVVVKVVSGNLNNQATIDRTGKSYKGIAKSNKQDITKSGFGAGIDASVFHGKPMNKPSKQARVLEKNVVNDPEDNTPGYTKNNSTINNNNTKDIIPVADSLQNAVATAIPNPDKAVQHHSLKQQDSVTTKKIKLKSGNVQMPSKGFYIVASIAADASGVKDISIMNTRLTYGGGVGYRFNKRLSVQTGFYAGKRIYTAGPDDYKTDPGSYVAKIIMVEGQCYIYDIPLTVRYDILPRKNYNVYLSTGFSSFILKSEDYDMKFFNPMGMYHHMTYSYKHNIDYLSILNLSVGFEHKLSSAFYAQVEPYYKLPLSGLGEGNVKLRSAGVQLGLKYQFGKKKR